MKSIRGYLSTKKLKARLEQPPVVFVQHVDGVEIKFAVHTWVEYHNRARDSYTGEPDTVKWIKENIRKDDVFWDIGANVGAYSLLAAKIELESKIVAFEPYIPTFAHLWDNIVLNTLQDRIVPLCVALSDRTHIDVLGIGDTRAGSSEHVLGRKGKGLTQPSQTMAADDVVKVLHVRSPTLVKLDVDGYELSVLAGMQELLRSPSLRSLIIEVERGTTDKGVAEMLETVGFCTTFKEVPEDRGAVFNVVYSRMSNSANS